MITLISFIIVFGFLVFIHEFGHFFMAKINGIYVHEFAIGMGPAIFEKKVGETKYALRLFPIGGYVMMEGEDGEQDDLNKSKNIDNTAITDISEKINNKKNTYETSFSENTEKIENNDKGVTIDPNRSFKNKSPLQRFSVLFAGAGMNFVSGILFMIIFYLLVGVPSSTIGGVIDGYPAQMAGIEVGDEVLSINGVTVDNWNQIINTIEQSSGNDLLFKINRENTIIDIPITPVQNEGSYKVGITTLSKKEVTSAVPKAFEDFSKIFREIFAFLSRIFQKDVAGSVVGPVGIAMVIGETAKSNLLGLFFIAGYLSINLGIMNLLPLPALDGGRIFFVLIEMITRKKVNAKFETATHTVGIVLLLTLTAVIFIKDIVGLF